MSVEWPSVTVVVTYYNEGELLHRALRSIFDQDYLGKIDVVVVDDCSEIPCPRDGIDSEKVRFFRTSTNSYAGAARNFGARFASGDYLVFLDADDVFLPIRVKSHIEFFLAHPDAVLVGGPGFLHRDEQVTPFLPLAIEMNAPAR